MAAVTTDVNATLPPNYGPDLDDDDAAQYIKETLKRDLPSSDRLKVDSDLKWKFVLDKHTTDDKKRNRRTKKNQHLTRDERKKLNLLKLPRAGWDYEKVLPINKMWKAYMRENLDLVKRAPSYTDVDYNSFNVVLSKSEFVGAEITVVRSVTPSYVGINGIVVLETKATFQVVTKDSKLKILLKQNSVFTMHLDDMKFTMFGKHLMTRPSERSVKKIKSFMLPDL